MLKVGDKVRVKKGFKCEGKMVYREMRKLEGEEATITEVTEVGDIKIDKSAWFWTADDFELIQAKQFTKSDLKDGDIVTYRNGNKRIVQEGDLKTINGDYGYELQGYREDLTEKYNYTGLDIIKVERPFTVFERKEEILDEVEKRYLRNVIKPWRDKVDYIQKWRYSTGIEVIKIKTHREMMTFPDLESNMYKGMEADRKYTLEELGL